MKALYSVFLAFVLACTSALTISVGAPVFQRIMTNSSHSISVAMNSPEMNEDVILATVKRIDHAQGLVYLDSEIGQLLTSVAPAALKLLHEGDLVLVHVKKGESPSENIARDAVYI